MSAAFSSHNCRGGQTMITRFDEKIGEFRQKVWDVTELKRLVFREMVKLAGPVLTNYHGDLWHDARWIDYRLDGCKTFCFVWSYDESGTTMGTHTHIERRNWRTIAGVNEL